MTFNLKIATIVFVVLISSLSSAYGQSSQDNKAKAYYFAAEDAYNNKQYYDALTAIAKVEGLLGRTNPVLSALKVKTYVGQGNFTVAKKEIDKFYSLDPAEHLAREMSPYLIKINKGITAARERTEAARRAEIDRHAAKKRAAIQYQKDLVSTFIPNAKKDVKKQNRLVDKLEKERSQFLRDSDYCKTRPSSRPRYRVCNNIRDMRTSTSCHDRLRRSVERSNRSCKTTRREISRDVKRAYERVKEANAKVYSLKAKIVTQPKPKIAPSKTGSLKDNKQNGVPGSLAAYKNKLSKFRLDLTGKPSAREARAMVNFLGATVSHDQNGLVIGRFSSVAAISIWDNAYGYKACYSLRFSVNLKGITDTSYHGHNNTYFEVCKKPNNRQPYFSRK